MKRAILIAAILLSYIAVAQEAQYFPKLAFDDDQRRNDFVVDWYSKNLRALQEPSLLAKANTSAQEYRFLWIRTFHNPIAVRVTINADGTSFLIVKVANGTGGYDPGKLVKNTKTKLSKQDTQWFLQWFDEKDYWNLKTRDDNEEVGFDGAQWILESVKDSNYKIVDRWSPKEGTVHDIGIIMLINLAKLKLLYQEVY